MAEQREQNGSSSVPVGSSGNPNWKGILQWSLKQADGQPSSRNLSEQDKQWFMEAMKANSVDIPKRMKEISAVISTPRNVLEEQGVTPQDIEGVLEELQEHVESIDMANDLKSIGGLDPLITLLNDNYAPIRARAAEVLSTMVQNNPQSQNNVMERRGLESLLSSFHSDPDVTVRTKALGAISSLIRNNKPATAVFRLGHGFPSLKAAISSDDARFRRKALHVTKYLLQSNPSDSARAVELGFPRLLLSLAGDTEADVREAALGTLWEVVRADDAQWGPGNGELKSVLKERIESLQQQAPEDTIKEERVLLDLLWTKCVGEPSALKQNGLLILPGEDELPPDVTAGLLEPPLRSLHRASDQVAQERAAGEQAQQEQAPKMLKM